MHDGRGSHRGTPTACIVFLTSASRLAAMTDTSKGCCPWINTPNSYGYCAEAEGYKGTDNDDLQRFCVSWWRRFRRDGGRKVQRKRDVSQFSCQCRRQGALSGVKGGKEAEGTKFKLIEVQEMRREAIYSGQGIRKKKNVLQEIMSVFMKISSNNLKIFEYLRE